MALSKTDVAVAVGTVSADPYDAQEITEALRKALPVLKQLVSDIPWWKKVFIGIGALIDVLEEMFDDA